MLSKITTKGWITIGIVIVLIIFLYLYFKNRNKITTTTTVTTPKGNTGGTSTGSVTTAVVAPTKDDSFPLGMGSRGDNVKTYQIYLNSLGANLKIDGIWGILTEAASIRFTKFNSIPQDYFDQVVDPYGDLLSTYQENNP